MKELMEFKTNKQTNKQKPSDRHIHLLAFPPQRKRMIQPKKKKKSLEGVVRHQQPFCKLVLLVVTCNAVLGAEPYNYKALRERERVASYQQKDRHLPVRHSPNQMATVYLNLWPS